MGSKLPTLSLLLSFVLFPLASLPAIEGSVLASCGCAARAARKPMVLANGTLVADDQSEDDEDGESACSAEVGPPLGMQVAALPSGSQVILGADKPRLSADAEGPTFPFVFSKALFVDVAEVSNERFSTFVIQTGYRTEAEKAGRQETWRFPDGPKGASVFAAFKSEHPVVRVSLLDALEFCRWAGQRETKRLAASSVAAVQRLPPLLLGRLPSEDEWEAAARFGDVTTDFPWGRGLVLSRTGSRKSRYFANLFGNDDGFDGTAPDSAFGPQNKLLGLRHLIGNAREWTLSPFCSEFGAGGEVSRGLRMKAEVKKIMLRANVGWYPSNRTTVASACSQEAFFSEVQALVAAAKTRGDDYARTFVSAFDFTVKGGSFLCDEAKCERHRLAERDKEKAGDERRDLGFRCAFEDAREEEPEAQPLQAEAEVNPLNGEVRLL